MESNSVICIAGKNEIAVYGLSLALSKVKKENIKVLCNSTDNGIDTWQPSLLKAAQKKNISVISIEDCYQIRDLIFLSLEYDKIISPKKFKKASLFNIHFSKLPSYKGMYTSSLPLLHGEMESGVSLHEIDSGIDTGDIIDQINFKIDKVDTARHLYSKYLFHSKKLLKKNFSNLLNRTIQSIPQSSLDSSYYSSKTIDYKNLEIDLLATAEQIKNQIRAFTFPEYQVPTIYGYHVNRALIQKVKSKKKPGNLLSVSEKELVISTVDYDLKLLRDKNSDLFDAAISDDISKAKKSINFGADPNTQNGNGWTPLIVACFNGSLNVARLLIKKGADVNKQNFKGTTPLMYAMSFYEKNKDRLLFDLLVKNGAKIENHDMHSKTILDYAKERKILNLFKPNKH